MTIDIARHLMVDFTQMKTFAENPLVLESGEGIRVTDNLGRTYIDGLSGVFTSNLGHGNPEIADALAVQARQLAFGAPTLGTNTRAAELVERLLALVPPQFATVKLLSGGSEANEAAIKVARQYHKQTGNAAKYKILSHYRGYHGGTGNALAASGWAGWKNAFEPLPAGFVHLHTPDADSPPHPAMSTEQAAEAYIRLLRATVELEGPETIAAIITEPILMSAGVVVPPDSYMRALREVCDEHNILLIFDEIITGFGRTGKWFGAEHPDVWPDIFCCGKGVTGGYSPLSIVFMADRVAEPFWGEPGTQLFAGHTYGGNPVACAAALAALEHMQAYDIVGQSDRTGTYLRERLGRLAERHPEIVLVRGRGMLQGIVFDQDSFAPRATRRIGLDVAAQARRRGLLLRAAPWFVAIAPPLVATTSDIDVILDIIGRSIEAVEHPRGI
ncbi:MAG: aspartate aminotransferase family protein [Chloroflexi bacterium]|nr:aspartate aminotransferase family protein [Chloroflexota bacterium]